MPQPSFDHLSERLLRAGIAPRHVRRYARELSDHFDDLVREEIAVCTARLIANPVAHKLRASVIDQLLERIGGA